MPKWVSSLIGSLVVIVAVVGVGASIVLYSHVKVLEGELATVIDRLAVEKAIAATGPCGDKDEVIIDAKRVVLAGRLIEAHERNNYEFRPSEKGLEVVWYSDPKSRHKWDSKIVMTRPKQDR